MNHCSVCGNLFRFCTCIDRTPWTMEAEPRSWVSEYLREIAEAAVDPSLIDPRHPSQYVPITEPTIVQAGDDEYLAIPINLSAEDMKAEIKRVRDLFAMAVADDDVADEAEEFLRGLT